MKWIWEYSSYYLIASSNACARYHMARLFSPVTSRAAGVPLYYRIVHHGVQTMSPQTAPAQLRLQVALRHSAI